MPCVLRVSGRKFDVTRYLADWELKTCLVYLAGISDSRRPNAKIPEKSGFNAPVSDADFSDLPQQVSDAQQFLLQNSEALQALMADPTVELRCLDFAIEMRNAFFQFDHFNSELIQLAGRFGLSIELSQYPPKHIKGRMKQLRQVLRRQA